MDDRIKAMLELPLDGSLVHTRQVQGRTLSYISAADAIAQANRIFGYDGWGYSVDRLEFLEQGVMALVTLKVDGVIDRQDVGFQPPSHARGAAATPESMDTDVKGAVSDALKRALRTFGPQFGLSLYGGGAPAPAAQGGYSGQTGRAPAAGAPDDPADPSCEVCGRAVGFMRNGNPWKRCFDCKDAPAGSRERVHSSVSRVTADRVADRTPAAAPAPAVDYRDVDMLLDALAHRAGVSGVEFRDTLRVMDGRAAAAKYGGAQRLKLAALEFYPHLAPGDGAAPAGASGRVDVEADPPLPF